MDDDQVDGRPATSAPEGPREATDAAPGGTPDPTHHQQFLLPHPPEPVWRAITDPDELEAWWGTGTSLDLRPGGEGRFCEPQRPTRRARVRHVESGHRLVLDWWPEDPEVDDPASRVTIRVEPHPDGSVLTVTERPLLTWSHLEARVGPAVLHRRRRPDPRPRALATV